MIQLHVCIIYCSYICGNSEATHMNMHVTIHADTTASWVVLTIHGITLLCKSSFAIITIEGYIP